MADEAFNYKLRLAINGDSNIGFICEPVYVLISNQQDNYCHNIEPRVDKMEYQYLFLLDSHSIHGKDVGS